MSEGDPEIEPERFEDATRVVARLVLGGRIELARPFGAKLALALGRGRTIADDALRTRIDLVRVRRARMIAPVDTLPDLDPNDWAIACAFNDLLQVTNHELGGRFTRSRYQRLLGNVGVLVSFWGALPGGILITVFVAGAGAAAGRRSGTY